MIRWKCSYGKSCECKSDLEKSECDLAYKKKMSKELNYEDWYDLHEGEINIELAEIGADREVGFDSELEFEVRYQDYLNKNKEDENKNT